LKPGNCQFPLS